MNICNKSDCLFQASLSSIVYCFWARSGTCPRVGHLLQVFHLGSLLP